MRFRRARKKRIPFTQQALLKLRHQKIHDRFVDLVVTRPRPEAKALQIMEKEFFLTTRALRRLLNTPLSLVSSTPHP